MRELIGQCAQCGVDIYCENGFINGYIDNDGKLSCFEENHLEPQASNEVKRCDRVEGH